MSILRSLLLVPRNLVIALLRVYRAVISPLYGGKVIAVQVYPRRDENGTQFETLLIRDGKLQRALPDGRVEPLEPSP